ncbi:MAG: hypothetical protein IPI79_15245 [Moraxellaceae bacterium]|nr:hypothetical protein [Moraxellaceae bacterium]
MLFEHIVDTALEETGAEELKQDIDLQARVGRLGLTSNIYSSDNNKC